MARAGGGHAFLGLGADAPPPSGPEDFGLKSAMLKEAAAGVVSHAGECLVAHLRLWRF